MEATLTKKDGKIQMDRSFKFICSILRNGEYTVIIKKKTQPKTLNQNTLMWKWFQCIGACLRGYTGGEYWNTAAGVQDIHDLYYKKSLVKQVHMNGKVETIVRGTSKLNTLEMRNFMESVKIDATIKFGVTLPLPEDQHYLDFIHEYQNRYQLILLQPMIANSRNYEPETIEFAIPDSIREKFPPVLFQGSTNVNELIELVNEHFNVALPESEVTQRLLDELEISEIYEEYCIKQENEVPKCERELLEATERAKKIKSDAQDRLASIKTEIKDLAAEVKKGTREYHLSSKSTIRFALDGYFLYYSWVNGEFKLVKAEKIPDQDKRSLRTQEDRNRKAMPDLFGIEYPEIERPIDDTEDYGDKFEEDLSDKLPEEEPEGDEQIAAQKRQGVQLCETACE